MSYSSAEAKDGMVWESDIPYLPDMNIFLSIYDLFFTLSEENLDPTPFTSFSNHSEPDVRRWERGE